MFHPVVQTWFARRFASPTGAQAQAWPSIAAGQDVLITAPTGSGKTLAAFLSSLDQLVRRALDGSLRNETSVVYVSPLKALSNDVRRNLEEPLAEMAVVATELGYGPLGIRTAVRTGDTSLSDRRAAVKAPPHVLVTTPESLFILLTSESGRRGLCRVRTLILDEIHAVAPDKRGAHLALSVERLEQLVSGTGGSPVQRIGLSATLRPMEVAARLLVGNARPAPLIVDASRARDLDLVIEVPRDELGAVCTNEQWAEIYDRLAGFTAEHRSTLVFVNTRRLVERVAHALGARLGPEVVAAHHGSLSREKRFAAEQRLKAGELKLVVATASLELGIDVGAVELTCLVGSPRSIATGLQRIGRSGHAVGGTPKGRLFPLTRDQLVECAALVRAARRAELDRVALRAAPLDVLAQQMVAACSCAEWDEDELFALMQRAAPYHELARSDFDDLVEMLSEGIATSRGRAGALLHRDGVNRKLRGRRGARLVALTSGGAIPDTALYDVVLEPEGTLIGTVDEDFAVDSSAGDVILLGNSSWRIRRIESGRVRVEDAAGAAPTIPFWFGEGPARTPELSAEVGRLREELAAATDAAEAEAWLVQECAVCPAGARLLREYVAAGSVALGGVPSQSTVIAERFFDESGGTQIIIHAPFGARITRAWGMALRKRFCRNFDFELQAAATDDGVLLSLGPQHSFPLETILEMLRPEQAPELLTQAALQAPIFETRWRWNAMRALAMRRRSGGKKIPPHLQRMRAQDLLAAVFPAQVACQDNHGGGPIEPPDHPLVKETVRDCLTEAMDVDGLVRVLQDLHSGRIGRVVRDTHEPSPFSHEILTANPYAFLDDAPAEERRTRAVSVRRGLPAALVERYGQLDPEALAEVVAEAAPDPRDSDELHDLLLDVGVWPDEAPASARWQAWFDALVAQRRAARLRVGSGEGTFWVAAERRSLALAVWPQAQLVPDVAEPPSRRAAAWQDATSDPTSALAEILRGHLSVLGPVTTSQLAGALAVSATELEAALCTLESTGVVMRGTFLPQQTATDTQWCDRRLLARINRLTVDGLRRAIEPATAAELLRFLFSWQHVRPSAMLQGRDGLLEVVGQLQGYEAAAGSWERWVLPGRVAGYEPRWLDDLCLAGEVAWGRLAAKPDGTAVASRAAPLSLLRRRDLTWTLGSRQDISDDGLSGKAREVLRVLRACGASFLDELAGAAGLLRGEAEEALWELIAAGRVTGDGFAGLRGLLPAEPSRGGGQGARFRWYERWSKREPTRLGAGRWSLLGVAAPAAEEQRNESWARQLLRRYGIVFRDLLAREGHAPPWRDLVRVYRQLEMRGEIRGGRLVAGFVGEQFALPEALEALRAIRRTPGTGETVRVSACDPLNLVGIVTPGARVPANLSNSVVFRDGVPLPPEAPVHRPLEPLEAFVAEGAP